MRGGRTLNDGVGKLLKTVEAVRPAFTKPGFGNFVVLFAGWIRTTGVRAVTEALVVTGVAGRRHHEAFHRFFSRGTWCPDAVGFLLFRLVRQVFAEARLFFVIDDTLVHKRGPQVYGIGSHIDPVRSTKRHRILAFGHVWVVFAVLVRVPFSSRPWALPLLFRLYLNRKDALRKGLPYRKKTELAREMLDLVAQWTGDQRVQVTMDSAYCCSTVMRGISERIVVFGAIRGNAVLTALPSPRRRRKPGRPSVRGKSLPSPIKLLECKAFQWLTCTATLYGETSTVRFKQVDAQWYRGAGPRLLRIIVRECDDSAMVRVFFCTDPSMSAKDILESYAERWGIEICFRELKQLLGFGDSSARKKEAVQRVAPFVGLSYTMLVLWFAQGVHATSLATPPIRPWYRHKRGLAFSDILRAARRALPSVEVLDLPWVRGASTKTAPPISSSKPRRGPSCLPAQPRRLKLAA